MVLTLFWCLMETRRWIYIYSTFSFMFFVATTWNKNTVLLASATSKWCMAATVHVSLYPPLFPVKSSRPHLHRRGKAIRILIRDGCLILRGLGNSGRASEKKARKVQQWRTGWHVQRGGHTHTHTHTTPLALGIWIETCSFFLRLLASPCFFFSPPFP